MVIACDLPLAFRALFEIERFSLSEEIDAAGEGESAVEFSVPARGYGLDVLLLCMLSSSLLPRGCHVAPSLSHCLLIMVVDLALAL